MRRDRLTIGDRGVERIGAGLGECQCLGFDPAIRHTHAFADRDGVADSGADAHTHAHTESDAIANAESDAIADAQPDAITHTESDALADS